MTDETRNLLAVAISKGMETTPLDPGEYHLTGLVTLEVEVCVNKGEPTFYRPTTSLPLKAVLAVALRLAGVEAQNVSRIVSQAAIECMKLGQAVKLPEIELTESALKSVEGMLDRLPSKTREGATKVEGTVELAGFAEARLPALVSA